MILYEQLTTAKLFLRTTACSRQSLKHCPGLRSLAPTQGAAPHNLSQFSGDCLWQDLFLIQEWIFFFYSPCLQHALQIASGILAQGQAGVIGGMVRSLTKEPSFLREWYCMCSWGVSWVVNRGRTEWGSLIGPVKDCRNSGPGQI